MTSNPDRCALGRQLLDRVVDAGLPCGGSAARGELARAREDLRRFDAESVAISIVRSLGALHDAHSVALQPDQLHRDCSL
jgi:hypothetical protein